MSRFGALMTSILLLAMSLLTGLAVASPGASDRPSAHRLLPGSGFLQKSETVNPDGTVAATWTKGLAQVNVNGAPGLTVQIVPDGVSVQAAPIDKSAPNAALDRIRVYIASGRSVVKDAIAVGMNPADAERIFGGHLNQPTLKALASFGATTSGASLPAAASGGILNSWCVSYTNPSGFVTATACDVQKLDQDNGGGDWYLADEQQASAKSSDTNVWFPDRVTQVNEKVGYSAGNQVVQWSPGSTQAIGACNTISYSISSGRTGFSYSQSFNVCPDSQGPFGLDTGTTSTAFGTVWNGTEPSANWYEGTGGVNLVHSPSTACDCPTLYLGVTWRN